jgi:hypothetical protein
MQIDGHNEAWVTAPDNPLRYNATDRGGVSVLQPLATSIETTEKQ